MKDKMYPIDHQGASLISKPSLEELAKITGIFEVECRDKNGKLKWKDTIKNLVVDVGKNWVLDGILGSAQTNTGPYMGLVSSVGYSAYNANSTMSAKNGWNEAGGANAPTYSGTRKTCVWSAASGGSKALSSALSFTFTGGGTVKGCFIVLGTGAVNTIDSTAGILYSAGNFTGGDKVVVSTDVLNVSYTASL
jgi:hypothetical protein